MSAREPGHGLRDWLGGLLSKWADRLLYGNGHELVIRDSAGNWVFGAAFPGGYVAYGPAEGYAFECCEIDLDDEDGDK